MVIFGHSVMVLNMKNMMLITNRVHGWLPPLLCLVAFSLWTGSALAAGKDYRAKGVIISATTHWKPYSFIDEKGEPAGFFVDYWRKWSEKTGIPVTFKVGPWAKTLEMVSSKEVDMHFGMYFTNKRALIFDYSKPVFYNKGVLIVREGIPCDSDLTVLAWGGVDGAVEKDQAQMIAGQTQVQSYENSVELLQAFADNEIQATVIDWSTVMFLGKEMGIQDSFQICRTLYQRDLLAAVARGNTKLLALINEGVSQITEEERQFLVNKWFVGEEVKSASWEKYLALGSLALLISFGVYHLSMRRRRE